MIYYFAQQKAVDVRIAIDFGASNTDVVASAGDALRRWTIAGNGAPDEPHLLAALAAGGADSESVASLAVTGGNRRALPPSLAGRPLVPVDEVSAIGRGGLALAGLDAALVVSAGSGTAVVAASGGACRHVTGTGVGGGTLLGLGRLLLGSAEPGELDALALAGNPNAVNLTIGEVIGGPIGRLPADTTAVNFGRAARRVVDARREDLAAALVNMVGQVIAVIAINAARSERLDPIVVVGHLADMASVRATLAQVGEFYGARIVIPEGGGYATALGALLVAEER
jgi:type II pantothenate kinase